jgi:hypothetical protein
MVNLKKVGATFGMLVSLAFLIHGCGGGGGGGGGGNNAGTATQSAATASKAIVSALGAATTGTNGGITKPSLKAKATLKLSDEAQVRQALREFKASLAARREKTLNATDTTNIPCGTGTGVIETNDNDTPSNFLDDTFTETFDNCTTTLGDDTTDTSDDFTFIQDGSFSLAATVNGETITGFTMTFENFSVHTETSFGTTESVQNGTMSFSGTEVACGEDTFLESGSFTMDFTSTTKVDANNDGTFESNQSSVMDNLTMTTAEAHADEPDCTPGATTFTMDGGMSFTDGVNSVNNFAVTFTDFEMVMTPTTVNGVDGDLLSVNGTIEITDGCSTGTFTISTPAGEEPFVPADGSCPISGKFLITSGGTTTAVEFTPSGGVNVDEGNNGSVDDSFDDCEGADICNAEV